MADLSWQARARCRDEDPELFFPVGEGPGSTEQVRVAKSVCARCPVQIKCLDFALAYPQIGVWGGTTDEERREMHRQAGRSTPKYRRPVAA